MHGYNYFSLSRYTLQRLFFMVFYKTVFRYFALIKQYLHLSVFICFFYVFSAYFLHFFAPYVIVHFLAVFFHFFLCFFWFSLLPVFSPFFSHIPIRTSTLSPTIAVTPFKKHRKNIEHSLIFLRRSCLLFL